MTATFLELAVLSAWVYGDVDGANLLPSENLIRGHWREVTNLMRQPKNRNGFYATIYERRFPENGERVIVVKGTDPTSKEDLMSDLAYGYDDLLYEVVGVPEYAKLSDFLERNGLVNDKTPYIICGHSLGGILAKLAACKYGMKGVAFNSPSVTDVYKILENVKSVFPCNLLTFYSFNDLVANIDVGDFQNTDRKYSSFAFDIPPISHELFDFTDLKAKFRDRHPRVMALEERLMHGGARDREKLFSDGYYMGSAAWALSSTISHIFHDASVKPIDGIIRKTIPVLLNKMLTSHLPFPPEFDAYVIMFGMLYLSDIHNKNKSKDIFKELGMEMLNQHSMRNLIAAMKSSNKAVVNQTPDDYF